MIYSIFPEKDTTLFEIKPTMNTGIDEILFIEKVISSSLQTTLGTSNSRIAMQFDLTDISESIANGNISSSSDIQFYLNLYTTKADSIPYQYTIVATPLSQSWDMGIGRTTHLPITKEGASWTYRFGYSDANAWTTAGGSTSSAYPIHTQSFTFESTDVRMNVSSSVALWLSSDIPNNGLLIMRSQSQELDNNQYGSLKFFSKDTHTVYLPKLEIAVVNLSTPLLNTDNYFGGEEGRIVTNMFGIGEIGGEYGLIMLYILLVFSFSSNRSWKTIMDAF